MSQPIEQDPAQSRRVNEVVEKVTIGTECNLRLGIDAPMPELVAVGCKVIPPDDPRLASKSLPYPNGVTRRIIELEARLKASEAGEQKAVAAAEELRIKLGSWMSECARLKLESARLNARNKALTEQLAAATADLSCLHQRCQAAADLLGDLAPPRESGGT